MRPAACAPRRAPRGERLVCPVPAGRRHTTTSLCGLRADGLVAPLVLDGAVDGRTSLAYVRRMLAPVSRPGDTVVMDSLGGHEVAGVREAIGARGASLRDLPAHSPDPNPIESAFSELERPLRTEAARTVGASWDAIGRLMDRFGPDGCARYIRHRGYAQSGS